MSQINRCDQCKREVPSEEAMVGWLVVRLRTKPEPDDSSAFSGMFKPKFPTDVVGDFCSWTCIGEHAVERRLIAEAGA